MNQKINKIFNITQSALRLLARSIGTRPDCFVSCRMEPGKLGDDRPEDGRREFVGVRGTKDVIKGRVFKIHFL